jgi:CHAT domain-containing protein/Flp pilus assembly protein TadD
MVQKVCLTVLYLLTGICVLKGQNTVTLLYDSAVKSFENRKYDQAFLHIEKALSLHKNQDSLYADFLALLGDIAYETGDKKQAEIYRDQELALRITIQGENHPKYTVCLSNLAGLYGELNQFADAESLFKQSILIQEKYFGKKYPNYALDLNNLAELYVRMDKLPEAEELHKQSLELHKEIFGTQHPDYALSLHNLGILYQKLGNIPLAISCLEEATQIRLSKLGENHPETASSVNSLAAAYHANEQYKEAEQMYNYVLLIREKLNGKKHPEYNIVLNNLAILHKDLGNYAYAESLFKECISFRKNYLPNGAKHPLYANSLRGMAQLYEAQGKYQVADSLYFQVYTIRAEALGEKHIEYGTSLRDIANIKFLKGEVKEAENYYEEAITHILGRIEYLFPSLSEKEKSRLYQFNLKPTLERFISFAMVYGGYIPSQKIKCETFNPAISEILYNNQLETKSLLLQATNKVRKNILNSKDTMLVKMYKEWQNEKEQIARYYNMSANQRNKLKINLDSAVLKADELEKQLCKKSNLFAQKMEQTKVSWKQVQEKLKTDEVAIEIVRFQWYEGGDNLSDSVKYIALLLYKGLKYPKVVILPEGNALEKGIFTFYKRSMKSKFEDTLSYHYFWKKIAESLPKNTKRIYFSADGVYYQINPNTLFNPQTGKYLIDKYEFVFLSSTKALVIKENQIIKEHKTPKNISIFAYPDYAYLDGRKNPPQKAEFVPLPGTLQELQKIQQLFSTSKWQIDTFTQTRAAEQWVKKINNPTILHIATHGNYDKKQVEILQKPQILLAGADYATSAELIPTQSGENGILTAYEAINLNLDKTELVVLSACETGVGDISSGEGVYGLQRSMQIAGAKAVVISLWKVNDEATQTLMTYFYNFYLKNKNYRKSLYQAQLVVRKQFAHPYFWGAFVLLE